MLTFSLSDITCLGMFLQLVRAREKGRRRNLELSSGEHHFLLLLCIYYQVLFCARRSANYFYVNICAISREI